MWGAWAWLLWLPAVAPAISMLMAWGSRAGRGWFLGRPTRHDQGVCATGQLQGYAAALEGMAVLGRTQWQVAAGAGMLTCWLGLLLKHETTTAQSAGWCMWMQATLLLWHDALPPECG